MTYQGLRRVAVPAQGRAVSQLKTFPAPVKGWVTAANLANAKPGQALILENFFPTQTGIQPRGGRAKQATIGTVAVERVFHYTGAGVSKLFAADETTISNITSPADPDVAPTPDVTGQTSGYYADALFTTTGGTFLVLVNGADKMQRFDGSVWLQITAASTDAITGVDTADLSHVWIYRNRMFFIEKDTLDVHYLSVDSIAGALGTKSLGGIFRRGVSLLFGATWSRDSGDGLNDLCVMVTTEGEIAIFNGSDPSGADPGDFDLVGRYDITKPLGKNVTMTAGGDLLVLTEDGIVPVSEAVTKDSAALSLSAVTRQIEPDWQTFVRARGTTPWEIAKWPSHNLAVISTPAAAEGDAEFCLVVNVETGAWTKYTNWDVRSLDVFEDRLFFGDRNGVIWEGETTGADGDDTIYCTYVGHADHLSSPGVTKTVHQMRSSFVARLPFIPKVSCSVNYTINLPTPPAVAPLTGAGWDVSLWDVGVWDDPGTDATMIQTRWTSVGVTGFAVNPQLQVSSNTPSRLDIQLVALDMLYEMAGITV